MEKELKDLLENEMLGEDVKTALQEAFESKVRLAEQKLQEDYAARYANDKATLVEAIDSMMNDAIKAELTEFAEDRKALISQKAKLSKATLEARRAYGKQLAEHTKLLNAFMAKQLKEEIVEFRADRKQLEAQRKQMAKEVRTIKESSKKQLAERVAKLESFVLKNLSEEIQEFQIDKKALVEQRAKLAAEGKKQINETRTKFLQKATSVVDKTLNEVIRNEMVQWRDDIKVARENNFGRRIFEAVAAEYMASYLSEGSEVKKLKTQLEESQKKIAETMTLVQKQQKLMEGVEAKARIASDRAVRMETMNELLSPLNREKKAVMEEMLRDIKTQNLKEAFSRYLPAVMNGAPQGVPAKQNLTETTKTKSVAVTGDRMNKLSEAVIEESKNPDIGQILYLAGLNKEVKENI
jgi:hypothetical protein